MCTAFVLARGGGSDEIDWSVGYRTQPCFTCIESDFVSYIRGKVVRRFRDVRPDVIAVLLIFGAPYIRNKA